MERKRGVGEQEKEQEGKVDMKEERLKDRENVHTFSAIMHIFWQYVS